MRDYVFVQNYIIILLLLASACCHAFLIARPRPPHKYYHQKDWRLARSPRLPSILASIDSTPSILASSSISFARLKIYYISCCLRSSLLPMARSTLVVTSLVYWQSLYMLWQLSRSFSLASVSSWQRWVSSSLSLSDSLSSWLMLRNLRVWLVSYLRVISSSVYILMILSTTLICLFSFYSYFLSLLSRLAMDSRILSMFKYGIFIISLSFFIFSTLSGNSIFISGQSYSSSLSSALPCSQDSCSYLIIFLCTKIQPSLNTFDEIHCCVQIACICCIQQSGIAQQRGTIDGHRSGVALLVELVEDVGVMVCGRGQRGGVQEAVGVAEQEGHVADLVLVLLH